MAIKQFKIPVSISESIFRNYCCPLKVFVNDKKLLADNNTSFYISLSYRFHHWNRHLSLVPALYSLP